MVEKVTTYLVQGTLWAFSLLPLKALRWIGRSVGRWSWRLKSRGARSTLVNVAYCYPTLNDAEQREFAVQSLAHSGCVPFETAFLWFASERHLQGAIHAVHGLEQLKESVDKDGVVCVIPHLGCWELAGWFLGGQFRTIALYDPRRLASLERLVSQRRSRYGCEVVPADIGGLRRLLQASGPGRLTLVLPDQVPTRGQHVVVPFLGHDAHTTTLVYKLLQRTQARAFVFSALRTDRGFEVWLDNLSGAIYDDECENSCAAMNEAIEVALNRDATQYQWEYKRFRRVSDIYNEPPTAQEFTG